MTSARIADSRTRRKLFASHTPHRYWRSNGATGSALLWEQASTTLGKSVLAATVSYAHAHGAVVLVSAGGPTDSPFGGSAVSYGTSAAAWAAAYGLDGVDFTLNNISAGFTAASLNATALTDWVASAATSAAAGLAAASNTSVGCGGSKLVTHTAPVSAGDACVR